MLIRNMLKIKRKLLDENTLISNFTIAYNVPTLGEGVDFNHKYWCEKQMLNIAVNVERRTAPPLLPNVCYTPAIGWGMIDRYGKSFFSFGASLEISYNLSPKINLIVLNQLTDRKDLKWLWGDNKIGYSFFLGVEIKL